MASSKRTPRLRSLVLALTSSHSNQTKQENHNSIDVTTQLLFLDGHARRKKQFSSPSVQTSSYFTQRESNPSTRFCHGEDGFREKDRKRSSSRLHFAGMPKLAPSR